MNEELSSLLELEPNEQDQNGQNEKLKSKFRVIN